MRYRAALDAAVEAAVEAGARLRAELHRPGGPRGRDDKAPIDAEIEAFLAVRLEAAMPEAGFRGEEDPALRRPSSPDAEGVSHGWIVDPHDGTSPFLQGWRGSTVAIGLVRDGLPVLGVVYAYAAPDDDGDLFAWAEGCGALERNGRAIDDPGWPAALDGNALLLVTHHADGNPPPDPALFGAFRVLAMPSIAYRLALAAAGDAAAAISLNAPAAHDLAAGHALLRAVGGELCDQRGTPIRYGDEPWRVRFSFGGGAPVIAALAAYDWARLGASIDPRATPPGRSHVAPRAGTLWSDAGRLRRAQGCWLGQLSGDALGSLVEFETPARIAAFRPGGVRELEDGGTWRTIAGQPTDDSEMAISLARALVSCEGYEEEAAAAAYVGWLASGPFDVGSTTRTALGAGAHAASGGEPALAQALRAAASTTSQANGALMRISPLAIFGHALPDAELARLARADAALTHPHPVCGDSNAVFVIALAHAIREGATPEGAYRAALAWSEAEDVQPSVRDALQRAKDAPPRDYLTQSGWVLVALQHAFHVLLHEPSMEEALVRTVGCGGDTDTNAAIAGALLGAVHGREALPWRWRSRVLSCRPMAGAPGVHKPRPPAYWPIDAMRLAERLLWLGSSAGRAG